MNWEKADLLLTDPPYNCCLWYETEEQAKARNRRTDWLKIKNDLMSKDEFRQFLVDVFSNAKMVKKKWANL